METVNKIKSRKELSIALSKGPVSDQLVSSKLQRVVSLWLKRKDIFITDGFLKLTA